MDLAFVRRLELAARHGWPATVQRPAPGGWVLRATPGLDRGRSNHALTPCRVLAAAELAPGIAAVEAFAREYDLRPGIQVSPLALHGELELELDARGWERQWPTVVLAGPSPPGELAGAGRSASPPARPAVGGRLIIADHADREWLAAWERCEPGQDVAAHAATVFATLRGRAAFARLDTAAVGLGVPSARVLGMFCLAVDPGRRRQGLGGALVAGLIGAVDGVDLAYLQVEASNAPACALYARLGFSEVYRYRHRIAPEPGPVGEVEVGSAPAAADDPLG